MLTRKLTWNKTILSIDPKEHENFVRTVIGTLEEVRGQKYKVKLKCVGWEFHPDTGPIFIGMTLPRMNDVEMTFSYIDCIEDELMAIFKSRMGTFLEAQGYEFNPITNAIMSIIHEIGHFVYNKTMLDSDIMDVYSYIYNSSNTVISMTLKDHEKDLLEEGIHARYLLSGDEMFCDGFAMTYFRAVVNLMIEKGFPEDILHEKFDIGDTIEGVVLE